MYATDVAVIGAGQAGLAMSRCLSGRGIDHVVFERGEVGARWQSHAWDSLRLLTPNWLNGLPGSPYQRRRPRRLHAPRRVPGAPAGLRRILLCAGRVADRRPFGLCTSATPSSSAPAAAAGAPARSWSRRDSAMSPSFRPSPARSVARVLNLHSSQYRSPLGIPEGGVLVVGASASGVQIADELRRSGRKVTLAVGRHTRAPRTWRGRDIFWWMDRAGHSCRTDPRLA